MIPYIFHISILIAICYVFYVLLLEKETFFKLNRWVLMAGMALAIALPFYQVPASYSLRQVPVYQETKPEMGIVENKHIEVAVNLVKETDVMISIPTPKLTETHNANTSRPATANNSEPTINEVTPSSISATETESLGLFSPLASLDFKLSFWEILYYIYFIGMGIFAINFLIQLSILLYKKWTSPTIEDGQFCIVEVKEDQAPFSFLNFIYINPTKYEWETYDQILEHEKIHVAQRHGLDILLAELLVVVQWFNPFAWLYRKAVENNLEFLTDKTMLEKGTDPQAYQMNLLKVSVPHLPLTLSTNYNQSILKKRISMMNIKKSSVASSWKYLFLLPLLGLSIITLNTVEITAQHNPIPEKTPTITIANQHGSTSVQGIPENSIVYTEQNHEPTSDVPLTASTQESMTTFGSWSEDEHGTVKLSGTTTIDGEYVALPNTGSWTADIEGNEVCFTFIKKKEGRRNYMFTTHECLPLNAVTPNPENSAGPYKITREAGTMDLNGQFENGEGLGKYTFTVSPDYKNYLSQEGYSDVDEELYIHLFLSDINRAYFTYLKQNGYDNLSEDELEVLAHHGLALADLKEMLPGFKEVGFDRLPFDDLMAFHIHNVSPEYVKEMKALGFRNLDADDIVGAKIHNVSPEFLKELADAGFPNMDIDEVTGFAIHNVDAAYIKQMKELGFRNMDADDIMGAKIHNVTPEFLKELADAGYANMDIEEVTAFAIHNVDAAYIKTMKELGFRTMDADDIVGAKIHNVSPELLQELADAGYANLDLEEVTAFAIHNVDAAYIKQMKELGFRVMSADDIVGAKIHNVSPEFLKELANAGFADMDLEQVTAFAIHNVDAAYVKKMKELGFRNMDADEIVAAKIHNVSPALLQELADAGFSDMDLDEVTGFAIHNVDAQFIKEMKDLGFDDLDMDDIVGAKIHGINANYIKSMRDLGFEKADIDDLVGAKIHGVDARFIQQARDNGYKNLGLDDYIELKIHNHQRKWKNSH